MKQGVIYFGKKQTIYEERMLSAYMHCNYGILQEQLKNIGRLNS
jgi:hypothetical protein